MLAWAPRLDKLVLVMGAERSKVYRWVLRESPPKGRNVTKTFVLPGQVEPPAAPPQGAVARKAGVPSEWHQECVGQVIVPQLILISNCPLLEPRVKLKHVDGNTVLS